MNLENLNLVALNAQEIQRVEGGFSLPRSHQGKYYNGVLASILGPGYDLAYLLGRYF